MMFLLKATLRRGERYLGRRGIRNIRQDTTRMKDKNDAKLTRKANDVRINWGVAGRGDDSKTMRLWLNVEKGGVVMRGKVDTYQLW